MEIVDLTLPTVMEHLLCARHYVGSLESTDNLRQSANPQGAQSLVGETQK